MVPEDHNHSRSLLSSGVGDRVLTLPAAGEPFRALAGSRGANPLLENLPKCKCDIKTTLSQVSPDAAKEDKYFSTTVPIKCHYYYFKKHIKSEFK